MNYEIKIAPSMLSCDFSKIGEELKCMKNCGADLIHLDVMDGEFVPNITFGMPVISAMRKQTDLFLDTHLMINKPERYIDEFVKAGSDNVTIHYESTDCVEKTLKHIKELGAKASLSIKPKTPVKDIYKYLPLCDMVLVMTVEPGFGGQSFMEDMMEKVEKLKEYRDNEGLSYEIQVDGGISEKTIGIAANAGANVFVAGSAVFKAEDRKATIANMKTIAKNNI